MSIIYTGRIERLWRHRFVRKLFGITVQLLYYILAFLQAPLLLAIEKLINEGDRVNFWRKISYVDARILFFLWGLRIQEVNKPHEQAPVIYACNHPSAFDGFTGMGILGPHVTMMTGPRTMFMYPFNFWFKKAGAVDVLRDWYDLEHFQDGDTPTIPEAIDLVVARLKKEDVCVFVEGHIEHSGRLQYVHTGVARIAMKANAPVIPMTFIGEQKFILRHEMRPGTLRVIYGDPIFPPTNADQPFSREDVRAFRDKIWNAMKNQLPHKYQRSLFDLGSRPDIAVFVDIDNTLYQGYSLKSFFLWLIRRGELSQQATWKIRFAVALNAVGVLSHENMMDHIAAQFNGWGVKKMKRLAQQCFDEVLRPKYNHDILAFLKDHQECGHTIVLVSESIQPIADCFKTIAGATYAFGSTLESMNGFYTGKIKRLLRGNEKRVCAKTFAQRHAIDLSQSFAYSDSMSDLPIMRLVGHPVIINAHDKMLFTVAQRRHWEVIQ